MKEEKILESDYLSEEELDLLRLIKKPKWYISYWLIFHVWETIM